MSKVEEPQSAEVPAISLACENLGLTVAVKGGASKRILRGVNLACANGDLVAFMGPSGSGKTTALRLLAGKVQRDPGSQVSGKVLLNGEVLGGNRPAKSMSLGLGITSLRTVAAFIPQEDNLLATMTCEEAFRFAAELRLPKQVDAEQRRARALEMMKSLGLEKCAGTKIGTPDEMIRGVSGGERRRVSIGIELLANPRIVFADEPTSGLDAHNASKVVNFFRTLCQDKGCIVVTSIHQPNSEIFQMYNKLLLLDEGRPLFCGEPYKEAIERFAEAGSPVPPMTNPADHYIYVISEGTAASARLKEKLAQLQIDRSKSEQASKAPQVDPQAVASKVSSSAQLRQESVPLSRQAKVLLLRHVRNQIRNPFLTIARYFMALFMGSIMSIMWSGLGHNQRSIDDRHLLMMVCCLLPIFLSILPTLQAFPAEKPTIVRECGSGMYSLTLYSVTRFIVELPVLLTAPLLLSSLLFNIIGLNSVDAWRFPKFYIIQTLCCNIGMGYGYLISTLAPNPEAAVALMPMVMLWEILFSGGTSCICDMPTWLQWLQNFSPLRYALTAIWKNEFEGLKFECEPDELRALPDGTQVCAITTGEAVLGVQDLLDYDVEQCIIALGCWFVILRVLSHLAMVRAVSSTPLSMLCARGKVAGESHEETPEAPQAPTSAAAEEAVDASPTDRQIRPGSSATKVFLESKGVNYSVPAADGKKVLVSDLNLSLGSGDMVAIMGTSGSGKTTSLRLLAGKRKRIKGAELEGEITVNGRPMDTVFQENSVFIPQNDAILATMTVREALTLSAALRLPRTMQKEEKKRRVDEMIEWLGLPRCQDTLVGTDDETIRGVSGGERRRVSIGMELLVEPSACFADEPTSGLDAHTAMSCLQFMRQLVDKRGCLVVLSIHQPSLQMLQLFSKVLLMSEGRTAFFGPYEQAVPFFSRMSFPLPDRMNPADHFMTVLSSGDLAQRAQRAMDFERGFKALESDSGINGAPSSVTAWEDGSPKSAVLQRRPPRAGFLEVQSYLMVRMWKNNIRNKLVLAMRSVQQVIFALVIGLMFGFVGPQNMENDQGSIFKRQASFFFATFMSYAMSAMGVAQVFCSEKGSFLREYQSGFYSVSEYFLARIVVELPLGIFIPTIFSVATWCLLGWRMSFFDWWLIQVLLNNAGQGLGFILAAPANTVEEAMNLEPPFTMLNMMFAGFFVNLKTIPSALRWLQYGSIMRYAFGAAMWKEFEGLELTCTPEELAALGGRGVCPITDGMQVIHLKNLENLDGEDCMWCCLAFFVITRVLGCFFVWVWVRLKTA